jgi:enoyl-CoA hydratase/carnithine racemase
MLEETVSTETRDNLGILTLDNPAQRNPLSANTMKSVTTALQRLSASEEVGCVLLRANGPVFSAGHDLNEMVGRSLEDEQQIFALCTEMMETIQEIPQPVVAVVQGPAMAAGCQLVATCDVVVAGDEAAFSTPGVKIGLFCSTPMVAISRAIGRKRALQMLLTGEPVGASTAADWGLINEVVPPEKLDERAEELGRHIGGASRLTLKIGKQAFYRQIDLPQKEAYSEMSEVMATNAIAHDAQEGMSAFLEKRSPKWRGE